MILGRPAALWASLIAAAINVVVFVGGVPWTTDQVVILNAFALAVIGVLANVAVTGTFFGAKQEEGKQ